MRVLPEALELRCLVLPGVVGLILAACDPGPPVEVRVVQSIPEPGPTADAWVMYANEDGEHVGTVTTDADGVAVIPEMPRGGFVTVAYPLNVFPAPHGVNNLGRDFYSFAGVQPGDVLQVGSLIRVTPTGTLTVSVEDPDNLGAEYTVEVPCGSGFFDADELPGTVDITLYEDCVSDDGELLIFGRALVDGQLVAVASQRITLAGGDAQVTLSSWSDSAMSVQAAFTREQSAGSGSVGVRGLFRGQSYLLGANASSMMAPGEQLTVDSPVPSGVFDRVSVFANHSIDGGRLRRRDAFGLGATIPATSHALADFLPIPSNPSADPERRSASLGFAETPTCGEATARAVLVSLQGYDPDSAFGAEVTNHWKLLAPYSASVKFPQLDPDLREELWPAKYIDEPDMRLTLLADSVFDYVDYRHRDPVRLETSNTVASAEGAATACVAEYGEILKMPAD